jgi:hypothetical protein
VVVKFANEVGGVDAVLFVAAVLLEALLPELGELVAESGDEEEGSCAVERVGEKVGRKEKRKRKSV